MKENKELMTNEEVVTEETTEQSFDVVKGLGVLALAYLGGKTLYKYVGKPIYNKFKRKKDEVEFEVVEQPIEEDNDSED